MHEDPTIMRWGFASFVVIGSLLVAMAVCWLHEHEIYVLRSVQRFLHRPIGEVLIVLVCVGGLVQYDVICSNKLEMSISKYYLGVY